MLFPAPLRFARHQPPGGIIRALQQGHPAVGPKRLDNAYAINGDQSLLPVKVFNDEIRTYIQWLALPAELPSVVIPDPNKTSFAELVNFRLVGSTYIVDGLNANYDLVWNVRTRNEKHIEIRHAAMKR